MKFYKVSYRYGVDSLAGETGYELIVADDGKDIKHYDAKYKKMLKSQYIGIEEIDVKEFVGGPPGTYESDYRRVDAKTNIIKGNLKKYQIGNIGKFKKFF